MKNIYLIFTVHQACGRCNADELYHIIEKINPQVIFEELSTANFDKSYQIKTLFTLETNAIKMYLLNHAIQHIPVDTYDRPKSYDEDVDSMHRKLICGAGKVSFELRSLIDNQQSMLGHYGFGFLNSNHNDEVMERLETLKIEALRIKEDSRLFSINEVHKDVLEKRENEMLNKIYDYCGKLQFETAIFFIGSGHRASILKKIGEEKKQNVIWKFYDDIATMYEE